MKAEREIIYLVSTALRGRQDSTPPPKKKSREGGKKKTCLTQQMIPRHVAVFTYEGSSNGIKHATVQRQRLNQVQARGNQIPPRPDVAPRITCRACKLLLFPSAGQFSPNRGVRPTATAAIEIKGGAREWGTWPDVIH